MHYQIVADVARGVFREEYEPEDVDDWYYGEELDGPEDFDDFSSPAAGSNTSSRVGSNSKKKQISR